MTTTDRTAIVRFDYVKSLRALADLIDSDETIPLPYQGDELTFFIHGDVEQALALHKLMEAPTLTQESGNFPVQITGRLAGFKVLVYVDEKAALAKAPFRPTFPALVPALAALTTDEQATA